MSCNPERHGKQYVSVCICHSDMSRPLAHCSGFSSPVEVRRTACAASGCCSLRRVPWCGLCQCRRGERPGLQQPCSWKLLPVQLQPPESWPVAFWLGRFLQNPQPLGSSCPVVQHSCRSPASAAPREMQSHTNRQARLRIAIFLWHCGLRMSLPNGSGTSGHAAAERHPCSRGVYSSVHASVTPAMSGSSIAWPTCIL